MISVRRGAQLGLFAAFAVLAGAMTTLVLAPRYSKPVAAADVGTLAPDFQLTDVDGRIFTLSQHRGERSCSSSARSILRAPRNTTRASNALPACTPTTIA
jgi:hypothetical protein